MGLLKILVGRVSHLAAVYIEAGRAAVLKEFETRGAVTRWWHTRHIIKLRDLKMSMDWVRVPGGRGDCDVGASVVCTTLALRPSGKQAADIVR